jgi:hypothetical protein
MPPFGFGRLQVAVRERWQPLGWLKVRRGHRGRDRLQQRRVDRVESEAGGAVHACVVA